MYGEGNKNTPPFLAALMTTLILGYDTVGYLIFIDNQNGNADF
jgi:hypothetical protein